MYASLNLLYSIEIEFQLNIKISSSDVIATNGTTSGIVDEIEYPIEMSIFTKTVGISLSSIEWNVAWFGN